MSSNEPGKQAKQPAKTDWPINLEAPIWSNEWSFFYRKRFLNMNASELAGNLSSILVLLAYSMSDMLLLRVTAICATLLSLCFQYYRPTPLWIPLRWNTVLLLINTTMVTTLYLERKRANELPPEMETLFHDGKFDKRGFSRVEFLRLIEKAETVILPPNYCIVNEGAKKKALYFLTDGKVRVTKGKENQHLATLEKHHFIGEISLLSRISQSCDSAASADCTVDKSASATFLKWDFETLEPFLKQDRQVFNALSAYFNYDLTAKLLRDGQIQQASTSTDEASQSVPPIEKASAKQTLVEEKQKVMPDKRGHSKKAPAAPRSSS